MITLEKELEHASSYLAIQNIRFKDKFEFHVDADPELLKYFCPKLSISIAGKCYLSWNGWNV